MLDNPAMTLPAAVSERLATRRGRVARERAIEFALFLAASVSVFTTLAIVYIVGFFANA